MAKTAASNVTTGTKSIGEVHDALIDEAEKQAQFNSDANAIQTAQNQKFQDRLTAPNMKTADQARDEAMTALKADADQANAESPAASTEPVGPAPSVTQTITEGGSAPAAPATKTKADTKS